MVKIRWIYFFWIVLGGKEEYFIKKNLGEIIMFQGKSIHILAWKRSIRGINEWIKMVFFIINVFFKVVNFYQRKLSLYVFSSPCEKK